jgi:hypothetical protein
MGNSRRVTESVTIHLLGSTREPSCGCRSGAALRRAGAPPSSCRQEVEGRRRGRPRTGRDRPFDLMPGHQSATSVAWPAHVGGRAQSPPPRPVIVALAEAIEREGDAALHRPTGCSCGSTQSSGLESD